MKLSELLVNLDAIDIKGNTDIEINAVNYDSRKVKKSDIFVCIRGFVSDGHKYAKKAAELGASVIVCEEIIDLSPYEVTTILVENSRQSLAILAANYYGNPSKKMNMIGVTGTNGKTTTTFMIKDILQEEGKKVGLVGTIANYIGEKRIDTERTTPESLELQELFAKMVEEGCDYCVMEVSSHSLALDRVYGVDFKVGIFTNLTRDHLDFHKTFENYYKAKYKLFERSGICVVNKDDTYGKRVINDLLADGNKKIVSYSINEESDFTAFDEKTDSNTISYKLKTKDRTLDIVVGIPGEFNIYNSLGAVAAAKALNISIESIKKGIEEVVVPGRCEKAGLKFNLPYTIILDYAHTPDGLKNILETARGFTKNKLISVFGCGGDRDRVKRPQMGKIGTDLSDFAIITSDNPRTEDPDFIISEIIAGIEKDNYITMEPRKQAIRKALEIATNGDVVVIAGKGHEDYQILKNGKIHFDEREVIDNILSGGVE